MELSKHVTVIVQASALNYFPHFFLIKLSIYLSILINVQVRLLYTFHWKNVITFRKMPCFCDQDDDDEDGGGGDEADDDDGNVCVRDILIFHMEIICMAGWEYMCVRVFVCDQSSVEKWYEARTVVGDDDECVCMYEFRELHFLFITHLMFRRFIVMKNGVVFSRINHVCIGDQHSVCVWVCRELLP